MKRPMGVKPVILVITGKENVSARLRENLSSLGYDVLTQTSLQGADLKISHKKNPDLVLMDISQHHLSEGFGIVRSLLSEMDIPILFLGAGPEKEVWQQMSSGSPLSRVHPDYQIKDLKFRIDNALRFHQRMERLSLGQKPRWNQLCKMGEAVLFTDIKGNVSFLNSTARFLFGWTSETVLGKHFKNVYKNACDKEEELFLKLLERTLQNGICLQMTENIPSGKTGKTAQRNVVTSSIRDERGVITGAVLVVTHLLNEKRKNKLRSRSKLKNTTAAPPVLTLCPWCKCTRDNGEKWSSIEDYIAKKFSQEPEHCICPKCLKNLSRGLENIIG